MERTRERRRLGAFRGLAAATGALVAAATVMVSVGPAQAAACQGVKYTVASSWNGGYQANVSITAGSEAVNGWTLQFDLPQGATVASAWNTTLSQSGTAVSAKDVGWNASVAAGSTREVFGAVVNGTAGVPTTFTLNGQTCGASNATPSATASPTRTATPTATASPQPTGTAVPTAPTPGTSLPPASAARSMAYDLVLRDDAKGYLPRSGECSKDVHAEYWTYGPDGKVYPTWHPTRDSSGCYFGHEHGDDPRNASALTTRYGWPAFGFTSERLMESATSASSHRHEDHVGHKIVAMTNVKAIQGDDGSALFAPSGSTVATCDLMIKFHQGTHSPDAFTNNMHEVLLNQSCARSDGSRFETSYSALMPFGDPGTFATHDCPGPFLSRTVNAGTAVPADSPQDPSSIGRLITAEDCAQAIRDHKLRYDPISGGQVPLDSDQLHEFWFGTGQISGAGVSFKISPLLYSLRPSRYYDPSKPNNLGRQVDLCKDPTIGGDPCDIVRRAGGNVAWDDPKSPFNGALRDVRIGAVTQTAASGGVTVYTDAYGRNASTTPFAGSIKQYFSGNSGSGIYLRAALKDWTATGVHAPN